MQKPIFLGIVSLTFCLQLSAEFETTRIENFRNEIQEAILNQTQYDRSVIKRAKEIEFLNRTLDPSVQKYEFPADYEAAVERMAARELSIQNECLNGSIKKDLRAALRDNCSILEIAEACQTADESGAIKKDRMGAKRRGLDASAYKNENPDNGLVSNTEALMKNLIADIKAHRVANNACLAELKATTTPKCLSTYNTIFTPETISEIANSCTFESFNSEINKFISYMRSRSGLAQKLDDGVKFYRDSREKEITLNNFLIGVDDFYKAIKPEVRAPASEDQKPKVNDQYLGS